MKARRMLLMVLIAAAMVFAATLNVAFAEKAEWQEVPENTEEIGIDETKDVDISSEGETVTFKFTPEEDGVYEFRSFQDGPYDDYDSLDTVGRVLIWNGNEYEEIMENDDNDENYHFCMKFKAEKEKTYYLQARMLSKPSEAVSFHVKLIDTGILEIEYKQKNQLELQYLVDGYYRNRYDDDDNFLGSFFRYYIGRKLPMDQDQFTIKKKNGDDITYVYNAENRQFECDGSDPIRYYDFDFDCVDSYNWDLGEHQAEVYYDGFTTETTVKVVENDIKAVSFQKKEPVTYYENDIDSGEWQGEGEDKYYCYYKPWLITGDKLTVTYTDDSSREFTLKYEDEEEEPVFMSEDGTVIDKGAVLISDEQETRHWGIGENLDEKPDGNNFYTVSYGGEKAIIR